MGGFIKQLLNDSGVKTSGKSGDILNWEEKWKEAERGGFGRNGISDVGRTWTDVRDSVIDTDKAKNRGKKQEKERLDAIAAPGIEMARRDAIPLMQDESAMEAAKKRAMINQQKRSGRESTMLTVGLGK